MRRGIQWALLETKGGDLALRAVEKLTGCALVRLEEIEDVRVAATPKGNAAAAKSGAPTRL